MGILLNTPWDWGYAVELPLGVGRGVSVFDISDRIRMEGTC